MNKRGFTLIELLVSFALITIVSLSLFKTVLVIQKKSIKDLSYNQYITFASTFSSNIQKDFTTDKITSFTSCGTNCYDIVYETAGTKEIKIDRTNNTMSYGTIKEKLPNNYIFYGDLILELNKIDGMATNNYNSIITLNVPIKSNLTEDYSNITYTYQYDDRVYENISKTLTVNTNGGTWSGTTPQSLLSGGTTTIANPTRSGYAFNGWTVSGTGNSISGTTFTMGSVDATLTANWLAYASLYTYTGNSTIIDDGTGNWAIKFLTSGTLVMNWSGSTDVLVVGGGGGGGSHVAGGGGGGGFIYNESYQITANNSITVTVGNGGAGGASNNPGTNGGNSVFGSLTAIGGGGGGTYYGENVAGCPGKSGGSGGGAGGTEGTATCAGGIGTVGQGNNGGNNGPRSGQTNSSGTGGGGAGAAALNMATAYDATRRDGGAGLSSSILGTVYYFSGGGGSGTYNAVVGGYGGAGGGGGGASTGTTGGLGNTQSINFAGNGNSGAGAAGGNGATNSGGGGGGGSGGSPGVGGNGGSGIVIIRNHR